MSLHPTFQLHLLNDAGNQKVFQAARIFSDALAKLEKLLPPGREAALVVTKMQEASFFANRGIALQPENQE